MTVGRYVRIVNDPICKALNGMAGKITDIEKWNGQTFYRVEAENFGPYLLTTRGGEKKIRAWVRDNWRRVPASALDLI